MNLLPRVTLYVVLLWFSNDFNHLLTAHSSRTLIITCEEMTGFEEFEINENSLNLYVYDGGSTFDNNGGKSLKA